MNTGLCAANTGRASARCLRPSTLSSSTASTPQQLVDGATSLTPSEFSSARYPSTLDRLESMSELNEG